MFNSRSDETYRRTGKFENDIEGVEYDKSLTVAEPIILRNRQIFTDPKSQEDKFL